MAFQERIDQLTQDHKQISNVPMTYYPSSTVSSDIGTRIRLHMILKLSRVLLTAQCAVDAISIYWYFLLQALAMVLQLL